MKCRKCGAELKPGAKYCGKCATPVTGLPKMEDVMKHFSGVNRMSQGIALGTEERVVKQYQIGRYTLRQGSIDVVITNKRVIRYEDSLWFGLRNNRIDEVDIEAVYGMSTSMMRSISGLGITAAIIFALVAYFTMSGNMRYGVSSMGIGAISLVLSVLILVNSFRPTLLFYLHGAVGAPTLHTVVNARGRLFGKNDTSIVFQFKPTTETTEMLKEIGAVIHDLKTYGDAAIEKWS